MFSALAGVACGDDDAANGPELCQSDGDCASRAPELVCGSGVPRECVCDPNRCPAGQDCLSEEGPCGDVVCSARVPCASPTDFCEVATGRCFPSNGDCRTLGCPALEKSLRQLARVICNSQKICEVRLASSKPAFLAASSDVPVQKPDPGTIYADGELPFVEWTAVPDPIIAVVSDRRAATRIDLQAGLIWGATVPGGFSGPIEWEEGRPIVDGVWQDASPARPANGQYFLLVQVLRGERVVGASSWIPFVIGSADVNENGAAGIVCSPDGAAPECAHPSMPMSCVAGQCRRLCASSLECGGTSCEAHDGMRLCAL